MDIRTEKRYSVNLVRANPHLLFVFGDNCKRYGKGGQAIIRDEPNTLGICTKYSPTRDPEAYFRDTQEELEIVKNDFKRLRREMESGKYSGVVIPLDGIGTGLAELSTRAPKVLDYINNLINDLFEGSRLD